MKLIKRCLLLCTTLLISCTSSITHDTPSFLFLDAGKSDSAVILCHGRGQSPDGFVVDPLRKAIHQQLAFHTLSLHMPSREGNWEEYAYLFPEAYHQIQYSINWLRSQKNVKNIYLIGHSMGSRMASGFISANPDAGIAGFIGIGMRNNGSHPLNAKENLENVSIPVLDLYGDGGNKKDAEHADKRKSLRSDHYQQILVSGASHRFTKHQQELEQAVINWLQQSQHP